MLIIGLLILAIFLINEKGVKKSKDTNEFLLYTGSQILLCTIIFTSGNDLINFSNQYISQPNQLYGLTLIVCLLLGIINRSTRKRIRLQEE